MTIRYYGHKTLFQGRSKGEAREKEGRRKGEGSSMICCFSHRYLRYAVSLLLMMVVGVSGVWGQIDDGYYYIANNNDKAPTYSVSSPQTNYYMCPTESYVFYLYENNTNKYTTTDTDKPFITTYQCYNHDEFDLSKALWKIQNIEGTNQCYIIHQKTGKYLTFHGQISGTSKSGRMRFHLESFANPPGNGSKFIITLNNGYYNISPVNSTSNYLNPAKGNYDNLAGDPGDNNSYIGQEGAPSDISIYGIVGIYDKATDAGSKWYFEKVKPIVSYNSDNSIEISFPYAENVTIYYTTDGSDPTDNTNGNRLTYTGTPISLTSVVNIKAAAFVNNGYSEITTNSYVPVGSSNPYLLQSVENANFYMTVGDVSGSNTTVNTSSLPQVGMSWHFEDAGTTDGVQYYYIYNTSAAGYLQRNSDNLYIVNTKTDTDPFKFSITPYYDGETLSGYNIYSKEAKKYVYKKNGNGTTDAVLLNSANNADYFRWNLILVANKNFPSPVSVSDNTSATYYTFTSSDATSYRITPPTGTATYVKTSNGVSDYQKWYFMVAGDDGWATYYYILNAMTGEAMYFAKDAASTTISDALEMGALPNTPTDNYKFALAKTTVDGEYYIIPKPLAQFTKTNYSGVWYVNTSSSLQTQSNRANNKIKWQISEVENYVAPPYITYDVATNTASISCTYPGATIYYTTDGTEATTSSLSSVAPVAPNPTASTSFVLTAGVTKIRAIVSKDGVGTSTESIYEVLIQTTIDATDANKRPYLIRSYNKRWTIEGESQGVYFMIPGDDDGSGNTTVNTSSLLRPTMEWLFKYVTTENNTVYYYIVNNSSGDYLYYDSSAASGSQIVVKASSSFSDSDDGYKFSIPSYSSSGTIVGYNIQPYSLTSGNRFLQKGSNNDNVARVTLSNSNSSESSCWHFILYADLNTTPPFTVSDNSKAYYYKMSTNATSASVITPAATAGGYVTTSATVADNQDWYFEQVETATNSDWLTYYNIRNALTGEYLYYTGAVSSANQSNAFVLHSSIDNSNAERYKFAFARSWVEDRWFIVPKPLKNETLANICSMWRDNNNPLKTQATRSNGNAIWQFTASALCLPPVFEESNGNITISCATNGAEIHYQTADDSEPTDASTLYDSSNDSWPSTEQVRIKAIAVVKSGETVTASSDVVTLLNKPNITLSENAYTYDGTAKEPTVTEVSIGETGSKTTAPTSPATYTFSYANNVNAGTATVTITDADLTDNLYIWNGYTTFTIAPAALTVTADAKSKEYRDDDPELTYTYSGLVGGESIGDNLTGALVRETGDNVGTYAINIGTLACSSGNYSINFSGATFTITPKSLGSGIAPATGITIDAITKSSNTYSVPGISHNSTPLTVGTEGTAYDYFLSTDDSNPKYHIVTFTGANNYTGSVKAKFVNVDFHPNSANTEWTSSFVIGSGEGAFATPTGYTAHIVTGVSGNVVTAPSLSYIPEDVPVILLSTASSNGFMAQPTSGAAPTVSENKLAVSTGTSFTAGQIYILYNGEFVLNAAGTLEAGKIYLPKSAIVSGSRPAPARLTINWGEATSIEDSHLSPLTSHPSGSWYTLDGRRLNGKPVKKGLYLRNGQKIVVR